MRQQQGHLGTELRVLRIQPSKAYGTPHKHRDAYGLHFFHHLHTIAVDCSGTDLKDGANCPAPARPAHLITGHGSSLEGVCFAKVLAAGRRSMDPQQKILRRKFSCEVFAVAAIVAAVAGR
jgi:hypothetical protein